MLVFPESPSNRLVLRQMTVKGHEHEAIEAVTAIKRSYYNVHDGYIGLRRKNFSGQAYYHRWQLNYRLCQKGIA
jgi:hypothetical protein